MATFEEKEEYRTSVGLLKAAFAAPKRGTVIVWSDVEKVMGRHRDERGGRHIIGRFRKWLLREHRIVTYPDIDVGLRLLDDRTAMKEVPERRQRRARNQLRRGLRELDAVDGRHLSARERSILFVQRRNILETRRALTRSTRALAVTLRDREVRPTLAPPPEIEPRPKPRYEPREGPPRLRPSL